MHPYPIEEFAAAHMADLRREAEADRLAATVARRKGRDRWAAALARLPVPAGRASAPEAVGVCCSA